MANWIDEGSAQACILCFPCDSTEMGAILYIHLVFLINEIGHKETQHLCYAQIIP